LKISKRDPPLKAKIFNVVLAKIWGKISKIEGK
jgi:hypothetical protein